MKAPSLIGGIGLTRVTVYEQRPAPDGLHSGCPHLHALSDEAYYVLEGEGEVAFFDAVHGLRKLKLEPGLYLHFPPLVLHRIISFRRLAILGIMGSTGLAERGDARIYFGPAADADAGEYERLRSLPARLGLEGALERRDASVRAFGELLRLWEEDRAAARERFEAFVSAHLQAAANLREPFRALIDTGSLAWGQRAAQRLEALPGRGPEGPEIGFERQPQGTCFGMCGLLHPVTQLTALGS